MQCYFLLIRFVELLFCLSSVSLSGNEQFKKVIVVLYFLVTRYFDILFLIFLSFIFPCFVFSFSFASLSVLLKSLLIHILSSCEILLFSSLILCHSCFFGFSSFALSAVSVSGNEEFKKVIVTSHFLIVQDLITLFVIIFFYFVSFLDYILV